MIKTGYLFAWLGTLALLATTCQAQSRRGGRNRQRSYRTSQSTFFQLLDMRPVRSELKLRELQIKMLGDLEADMSEQIRAADFNNAQDDPRNPRGSEGSERRTQDRHKKILGQGEILAKIILDSEQTTRFGQVRLQYEGTRALVRRPFRDQLGVTDEQYKKIQDLLPVQDDRSTLGRPEKNLDESVLALLSKEQQVKLKELRGETFDFPLQLSPRYRRSQ